jgi:hypothetical protein
VISCNAIQMNPASNPEPTDAQVPAQRSGRYRYCAGRPLDPIEATHPELTADGSPAIESSGVPDSPAALVAMQDSSNTPRPEKPERKTSAKVEQVLELLDRLETSAGEDLHLAQRLVRKLENFHDNVVEEMRDDQEASHSQLIAWSIDADRLMRSRLLLESVDLE